MPCHLLASWHRMRPMKMAIYMMGALALIVIGSLAWSTSLLGAH
jgi:hypothetical protein